jgi:hypothetical protein
MSLDKNTTPYTLDNYNFFNQTVTPQNRHLANYSNHATILTMSLWKRTTKQNMHVATYTLCGWNQDSNVTRVHDGTHKRIYT